MKSTILITGATGNTGLPLVQALLSAGAPFRVMIHTPSKINLFDGKQVEVAIGDYSDVGSLERALEGITNAYLVSPASPQQVRHQSDFVDAAKKLGVKHIVKLSALGTAPDSPVGLLRGHAEIEEYIRKSGIAYTFLHPHFFMENFLASAQTVEKDGTIYSPLGDARISTISVQDIAAVAAKVLTGMGHGGKTYALTGPEAVTYAEIAQALSAATGKPVKYVQVSFDTAKQGMMRMGMPEWFADDLIKLMQTWTEGKGEIVSRHVENVAGRKPQSIREFFLKHKNLFLAAA